MLCDFYKFYSSIEPNSEDKSTNLNNFKHLSATESNSNEKVFKHPRNLMRGVKRKFPGPAGILPDFKCNNTVILNYNNNSKHNEHEEIPCSQNTVSTFNDGPWQKMIDDFQKDSTNIHFLLQKYNIKRIKMKANLNQLVNQKTPFLAAVIQNIECFEGNTPTISLTLKDMSGEIQGTINHKEEYLNELKIGSVLVLKQCGVLTTSSNCNHYLTITENNLLRIYTQNNCNNRVRDSSCDDTNNSIQKNKIKKIILQNILFDDLLISENTISDGGINSTSELVKKKISFNSKASKILDNQIHLPNNTSCNHMLFNSFDNENDNFHNEIIARSSQLSTATNNVKDRELLQSFSFNDMPDSEKTIKEIDNSKNELVKKKFNFNSKTTTVLGNKLNSAKEDIGNLWFNCFNKGIDKSNKKIVVNYSQLSIKTNNDEDRKIVENAFDGIDTNLLFEDF